MSKDHSRRVALNAASRERAANTKLPWEPHELELLFKWDRSPEQLLELAELLERTVEGCRERYYRHQRPGTTTVTETETRTTTTTYRGWMEGDGDGWD